VSVTPDGQATQRISADRSDALISIDPYLRLHLPYTFPFTPYIQGSIGPRVSQTRYFITSSDGKSELTLYERNDWALEFNFGGGFVWVYGHDQNSDGGFLTMGVEYAGTLGDKTVTRREANTEFSYRLPNGALRLQLGWGVRL
jgi:hypothetical protein